MPSEDDLLKEVSLFHFLDDQERAALAATMDVVEYAPGATVFNIGEPGDALYVVATGQAEVFFKNDTGERIVLELAERGGYFGELSLMDGGSRSASVMAKEQLTLWRLNREELEAFLKSHPQAAMDLLAAMGRRLRTTVEHLRHTATRNVNEEVEDTRGPITKAADWIAAFSGSITFLIIHIIGFAIWILLNVVDIPGFKHFDEYPFGFLTLSVSLEAIFLSVFVLLSQNRQAEKDRIRSDIEYDVNLKAELEIAHLHEKIDRLTADVLSGLKDVHQRIGRGR